MAKSFSVPSVRNNNLYFINIFLEIIGIYLQHDVENLGQTFKV